MEKGWKDVGRPGPLGINRNARYREWQEKYGPGNWRLVWRVGKAEADFIGVCALYEDAYFIFLERNYQVLYRLVHEACNVYDDNPSNVLSGFDYLHQETDSNHIQDIAIRRALLRSGRWFKGQELIPIKGNHPLGSLLSPGVIPFHNPALIVKPELLMRNEKRNYWWKPGSVESFYQSNKYLQVKS